MAVDPESGSTEVALDISDRVLGRRRAGPPGPRAPPDWPDDARATSTIRRSRATATRCSPNSASRMTRCPPRLDPATERVLLDARPAVREPQRRAARVRPGRHLYIGLGDGGPAATRSATARTSSTLLGKILRIDVDAAAASRTRSRPTTRSRDGGGRAARSGATACATRGASASTARPATSGSATSARTRVEEIDRSSPRPMRGGRTTAGT